MPMDIYIDDMPLAAPPSVRCAGELLTELRRRESDRLVVAIHLDGQEVPAEGLAALRHRPLDGPGRLDLTTESIRDLTARTLGQVIELLDQGRPHHQAIAELLAAGLTARAMERLTACFNIWDAAESALTRIAQLTGLDLDQPTPARHIEALRTHLSALRSALEARDFVAVADLVEAEMPALTDAWQDLLTALADQTGPDPAIQTP